MRFESEGNQKKKGLSKAWGGGVGNQAGAHNHSKGGKNDMDYFLNGGTDTGKRLIWIEEGIGTKF